jgi:hypothetical protein
MGRDAVLRCFRGYMEEALGLEALEAAGLRE